MSIADMFSQFVTNLAISNTENISLRYGELTAALNKTFRDTEAKTANTLQVGSFGRKTGVNGISDLDMLYIMPKSKWDTYQDSKQLKLLQDVKVSIWNRYPKTDVRVDRLVVTVTYVNFHIEVQPVFEQDDGTFKYPDTKNGGAWKITKPREEITAVAEMDVEKNSNLRRLCKMARSWRNKHGVGMGGLLIDTLAYNFLQSTSEYDAKSFLYYDELSRDFFEYLAELPNQDRYNALGSNQHVKVKKAFQRKARKAHGLCLKAIEAEGTKGANDKWKKVFGRPFPANTDLAKEIALASNTATWDNTEQFIEDYYPVDIRHTLKIDCDVMQNGFRENRLSVMIAKKIPLLAKKTLEFEIVKIDVPGDYSIEWKVLNRGDEARRRNKIRGQIVRDAGRYKKTEPTFFKGDHVVECYAIQEGVVVAKDRIHVPISTNG
ncbi:MAG TPA: nucleotidyltransferase [Bacteroidetes bacterium]|nr:nucleotidyltransferase [Bacteroidota bacterium]HEX03960.1 nucleotidyltransferase [Bacteroidota bacterium]